MVSKKLLTAGLVAGLAMTAYTPAASAADITLKYGMFGSGKSPFTTRGTTPWRAKIAELSGGKVEVKQFLNTLGPVQTYEHIQDDAQGVYRPAALLLDR